MHGNTVRKKQIDNAQNGNQKDNLQRLPQLFPEAVVSAAAAL